MTKKTKDIWENSEKIDWLLSAEEPWVKKLTLTDLLEKPRDDPEVQAADKALFSHPFVKNEIAFCKTWPGPALKRHNTAGHPFNRLGFLADIGYSMHIRGAKGLVNKLTAHRDKTTGYFETVIELPKVFGGSGKPEWCWMICDAPVLAHALYKFGLDDDPRVQAAYDHMASLATDIGWGCHSSFPKVRGPGRKDDPCPIANLLCLKALSLSPDHLDSDACRRGTEMLLSHWRQRKKKKYRMFGIGTDFAKIKYPNIWYDILHMVEVLSRFPWTLKDKRLLEMAEVIFSKADKDGRFKPESVWMPYKKFDFGQKRELSPMLTLSVMRIGKRLLPT
ncbi:MAG: hypothetical protein GY854_02800 [Deltaproteobacteria bacterium]|nr:hypothetical protein [Deltaproteobacteria bacterium]